MQIDYLQLKENESVIGIDKLSVFNFEINSMPKKTFSESATFLEEAVRIKDDLFYFEFYTRVYVDGRVSEYKTLTFNPNKLLFGHNILNASPEILCVALVKIKQVLKEHGIDIDFTNARIHEIEINQNYLINFVDYIEVFTVLFINQQNFKKISAGTKDTRFSKVFIDETLSSNINSSIVQVYDKTREVNNRELLRYDLTRLEWRFTGKAYKYWSTQKHGLDNKLKTLIDNFWLAESLFVTRTKNELFKKGFKFLREELQPKLETEYRAFRDTQRNARKKGEKMERGVYKHLEKKYWIFDYYYLILAVKKHNSHNLGREIKTISNKFSHHNGLDKLHSFFSSLISVNEEEYLGIDEAEHIDFKKLNQDLESDIESRDSLI